jgi:hypothetical protein
VQRGNSESEEKGSNILLAIGILLVVLGVVMILYLDKIMFGSVGLIGPIFIVLGTVFILLNLAVMIKERNRGSAR